ncbi:hypothetical protein [Streptomyces sp. JJ36]|uniref:hypothetical protein n=1 Tax=Streptomyces sp. JJ36 TaxID=2736645 RepID=UPI001F3B255A|nr:hypothetical protein [Streptomyces sp. JJ36]MCF6525288.1 hypothetical protein [Streptomyces sp. JJ36]
MLTTTVCAALSAAGLAVAFLTAWRRRFVAATRIAALALVPLGLAMAGLVELGGKIAGAAGEWAADLVFQPSVWAGFAVLAVAVVLWVIARVAAGRGGGAARPSRRERRAAARAEQQGETAPGASAPALGAGAAAGRSGGGTQAGGSHGGRKAGSGEDDFSEIEAILKKHGI